MKDEIISLVQKNKKTILVSGIFILILGGICAIFYQPLINAFSNRELIKAQLLSYGWLGKVIISAVMGFQVTFAFLPGEMIEVMAGVIYGPLEGMLLCLIGAALGSCLIYLFVQFLGKKSIEKLAGKENIEKFDFMQRIHNLPLLVFILFFIPGTPKDLLTYIIPFTKMRLGQFLLISSVARIPSVITSTLAGDSLIQKDMWISVAIFVATGIISLMGLFLYKMLIGRLGKEEVYER